MSDRQRLVSTFGLIIVREGDVGPTLRNFHYRADLVGAVESYRQSGIQTDLKGLVRLNWWPSAGGRRVQPHGILDSVELLDLGHLPNIGSVA